MGSACAADSGSTSAAQSASQKHRSGRLIELEHTLLRRTTCGQRLKAPPGSLSIRRRRGLGQALARDSDWLGAVYAARQRPRACLRARSRSPLRRLDRLARRRQQQLQAALERGRGDGLHVEDVLGKQYAPQHVEQQFESTPAAISPRASAGVSTLEICLNERARLFGLGPIANSSNTEWSAAITRADWVGHFR